MEDFALQVFSSEVRTQARWAVAAHEALERSANALGDVRDSFLWLALLTSCAANVSKLLFAEEKTEAERQRLRDHFQVPADSVLKSRRLRNHLEHFDERIADWAKPRPGGGPPKVFLDCFVGGPATPNQRAPMMFLGGTGPGDAFRYYDRGGFVIFRGERFDLLPMIADLRRLLTIEEYRPPPPAPPQRKSPGP